MAVTTTKTNKPINPRGNDQSPLAYNRAKLYSGKALDFDGVNDQITFGTISDLTFGTGDFSVVLDWQIDSVSTYSWAIAKNPATDLGIGINNTGGLLRLWIGGTLSLGTENILGSDWKKIAVVRESGVVSAYINGVAIPLTETAMAGSIDSGDLVVGSWVSNADFWNGLLNNIRIFNTALTAAQVADLYNNPEKIVPTGVEDTALKLWLPMMEGAGTTAYDGSGNGNHGTISGATWTHGIGAPVAQTAVIDWNKGQNLYAYSEQFDESSYWSYTQIHSVDSTDNEAPDGSLTADKLIANTNTAFHHIGKGVTGITIGISYRLSVWAKAGGHDYILINTAGGSSSGNAGPIVNLTDGSIAGSLNGEDYDATITDAGNGWYKIEYDFTSSGTTISIDYNQLPSASITAYAGDNTKGVYLWGASLRPASSGSTYVRTGATAQTSPVLLPQGLTTGRDITGVNLFENVRKQGALNLDGNSWAEVHDNASLDVSALTCEGWMYAESITGINNRIVNKWNSNYPERSFQLYGQNATINWMLSDGSAAYSITGGTLTQGEWHHVVGTYDGSTQKIYLNGVQVQSTALSITLKQSSFKVMLGGYTTGLYSLNPIAQPRIYNRALTAEEVERNYNAGKNIYK